MDPSPTLQSKSEHFWSYQSSALASQIVTLRSNFAVWQDNFCVTGRRAGADLHTTSPMSAAVIDVAFIVVGGPKLLPKARQTAEHLNATSSLPVHVHLVTDKRLPQQPWFTQHLLSAMPEEPAALHRNLSKLGVGPSFIYMYKPFPLPAAPARSRARARL